jgi:predicted TIM-barrel fold metal-dependent hydrolase
MLTDLLVRSVETWQDGLRMLAEQPNLYVKLSGLGTFVRRNDPEIIGFVIDKSIEILGSERLMFGSNFPIEKLWTEYALLVREYRQAIGRHGEKDLANIFETTAARVYRI